MAAALLLAPVASHAGTVWNMATEYPQNTMPGLGVTTFAKRLEETSAGDIKVKPGFDAVEGIKSAGMLAAVAANKVQAGDAFAGALEAEDPVFALPSLPFLATSIPDAKRLADLARPFIAAVVEKKGQRLLYLTPWPPSGIWSKTPLTSPADLAGLSIRTYDKVSSEVFASAGAKAASISFADTMPKLADGSMNAVLSSGDGGAGKRMSEFLHQFTEITYSLPLSVATVNQSVYDALSPELKTAVDAAGAQTEAALWEALSVRLAANYKAMVEYGVTIDTSPPPAVVAALQPGAVAAQRAWCTRAGAVCNQILDAFNAGKK
jgi:TRAP-type C4-dicarboxylate transport system substrate-binding protein